VVLRQDFDGVVAAVGAEIGGLVRQRILTAQLILDGYEGVGYIIELKWKESVTPVASAMRSRTLSPACRAPVILVLMV